MTGSDDSGTGTRPISVSELLAKNGTIGAPPVGRRRRRRRGNTDSVSVAELTGEIPIIRADEPDATSTTAADEEQFEEAEAETEVAEAEAESAEVAGGDGEVEADAEVADAVTDEDGEAVEVAGGDAEVEADAEVADAVTDEDGEAVEVAGGDAEVEADAEVADAVTDEDGEAVEVAGGDAEVEADAEVADAVTDEDDEAVEVEVEATEAVTDEDSEVETGSEVAESEAEDGEAEAEAAEVAREDAEVEIEAEVPETAEVGDDASASDDAAAAADCAAPVEHLGVDPGPVIEAPKRRRFSFGRRRRKKLKESGESLEAVESGESVDSGESVESGDSVESGESVEAVESREAVEAVEAMESGESVLDDAEHMSPDPLDDGEEETDVLDAQADPEAPPGIEDLHSEAESGAQDSEELPSYLRSTQEPLFGGQSIADDLARRGPKPGFDEINLGYGEELDEGFADEEDAEYSEPRRMASFVSGLWIIGQSIFAVLLGAGLFVAFDQLWKWNNIIALVLAVLVILGLVVAVRVVRKTEDIGSTLIAVAVGALVTLGPLMLPQSV